MAKNLLAVTTTGSERHDDYVRILREYADELAAGGVEYEEHDRRAEPVTTTLIISLLVSTGITTAVSESIKKIVNRLCESAKSKPTPAITFNINVFTYVLPQDQQTAVKKIDDLQGH
jgi:hypothetical protein